MTIVISSMRPEDWGEVRSIYLEGIATGHATFETGAPPQETWDAAHLKEARLVARDGDAVLGWAALSPVSSRCVYAGVAEVSVYVSAKARGRGVGRALLRELATTAAARGHARVSLSVQRGNFAQRLYVSEGYVTVASRDDADTMVRTVR